MRNQAAAPWRRAAAFPRGLLRLLTVACLLLGAVTQVWRVAHLLTERHVACPYDGVPVHVDELPEDASAANASASPASGKQVSVTPRHEHGRCGGHDAVDRPCALASPPAPRVARAWSVARHTPLPPVDRGVTRSVLSYAPKLPPPV